MYRKRYIQYMYISVPFCVPRECEDPEFTSYEALVLQIARLQLQEGQAEGKLSVIALRINYKTSKNIQPCFFLLFSINKSCLVCAREH